MIERALQVLSSTTKSLVLILSKFMIGFISLTLPPILEPIGLEAWTMHKHTLPCAETQFLLFRRPGQERSNS